MKSAVFLTAALEEERMNIEQLAVGWDDPTQVNWGEPEPAQPEPTEAPAPPLYKCTALYSYTVSVVGMPSIFVCLLATICYKVKLRLFHI